MIPEPGKVASILSGHNIDNGPFDFYRMFSGDGQGGAFKAPSAGSKPFIITETGATFHLSVVGAETPPSPGPGRVEIKRSWWRQLLNATFLAQYPKIKAICTFEFTKFEETTWRDFTNMGDTGTGINSPFGNDGGSQDLPVLEAFRSDLQSPQIDSLIIWGGPFVPPPSLSKGGLTPPEVSPKPKAKNDGRALKSNAWWMMGSFFFLILSWM